MLLHEFDPAADAVLNSQMCVDPIPHFPPVTVACFSHCLFEQALSFFDSPTVLATLRSAAGRKPLYQVRYRGQDFAFYQASVGEPMCVKEYEDIMAMGSRRLILLGTCGVLDRSIENCGIIIPTQAIRDEGCSYHYAPASDLIPVNRAHRETFQALLRELGYPYRESITWTTDALYRETTDKVARRKKQGAICVEMECAGMQALCQFRGTEFFQYFYAGDNLDHSS